MTITKDDIKLLASERMNDDADGGGFMTSVTVQDGVENNVFPDISELDRAQGANDFRKIYVAVLEQGASTYYGAHAIIDKIAEDPNVSSVIHPAASQSQSRSQFISYVDNGMSPSLTSGFRGTKTLIEPASIGDRDVKADGVSVQVIPNSSTGTPTSGLVISEQSLRRVLYPWTTTISAPTYDSGSGPRNLKFRHYSIPGSVSGSITVSGSGLTIDDTGANAYPVQLRKSGNPLTASFQAGGDYPGKMTIHMDIGQDITANTVVYKPGFDISLPMSIYELDFTTGMSYTQVMTLPYFFELGSVRVEWTNESGQTCYVYDFGPNHNYNDAYTNGNPYGDLTLTHPTKQVMVSFKPANRPKVGTKIKVTYVRTGFAQPLVFADLDNGGTFAGGLLDVNPSAGWQLVYASFKLGGAYYTLDGTDVMTEDGVVVGSYVPSLNRILMGGHDGQTVSEWMGVQTNQTAPITAITDATTEPNMVPETVTISGNKSAGGTFTVTADATGAFVDTFANGTYDKTTGKVNMTFTAAVEIASLEYDGTVKSYVPVSAAIAGFDPGGFNTDGTVDVMPLGAVVVLHNTQALAPQTVANAQVVNCGRTLLSDVRIFGDDGVEITSGFTVNKAAGTVTINNITGWDQPVTITHRVEDVSVIVLRDVSGQMTLSKPLSHAYPANTSYISSALIIGDMQARAHAGFQMQTWTNIWADTLEDSDGTAILADYNEASYPIVMENKGGIQERWLVKFTNTNTFTITGEQVGQIAVGDTSTACAPINPQTGRPYFTIPAAGWGSGWATGNCYRFNTEGGSVPVWTIRTVNPSDPWPTQDRITFAARGSLNA